MKYSKNIDKRVIDIMGVIERNGGSVYIVGGAVRDFIMKRKVNDYDLTTSLHPEKIVDIFNKKEFKTRTLGIKHGTVGVLYKGLFTEITTFREEGEYLDNRHPNKVLFSNKLEEDLKRRDFTINSIVCSKDGDIIDPFFGISDINNKLIRTITEARKVISDDALRILRAIRFSVTLGFKIDDELEEAIFKYYKNITDVSIERINWELEKILSCDNIDSIYKYMEVFAYCYKVKSPDRKILKFNNYISRMAYLLKKNNIDKLNLSNKVNKLINDINKNKDKNIETKYQIKKLIKEYGFDSARIIYEYNLIYNDKVNDLSRIDELKNACVNIKDLNIDAQYIISKGIKGEGIKKCLNLILEAVMKEEVNNIEHEIVSFINDKCH